MKKLTTLIAALFVCISIFGQPSKDYTVAIQLAVQQSPLSYKLTWRKASNATQYKVYSKLPGSLSWTERATLPATDTTYTDSTVSAGALVEYQVVKFTPGYNGHGYMYAGTGIDDYNYRGKLLLIVDSNYALPLATEIQQLQADLRGDGWQVITRYVARTHTPPQVKQHIIDLWQQDSASFKSVYLLGHVPVPYSGYVGPDGHTDHYGAWPTDLYYAMPENDQWTDYVLNVKVSTSPRNYNTPGDGKFDADAIIPGSVKLDVGRVDLFDMPAFGLSDTALVRRYLAKAHNFKHNRYAIVQRGLIEDAIGSFGGEAFVRGGWSSYAGMFGDSIREADFINELKARPYMFANTSGFGSYTSSSGIAGTNDFVNDSLTSPFITMFGSYFGDWDNSNNLLRAPLASRSLILTNVWSGRPVYYFHHMALGKTVGYSATASANAPRNIYYSVYLNNGVTMSLLGDPSLRLHPITPATGLSVTASCADVTIQWTASADTGIMAHRIYRATSANGKYELIGQTASSSFIDAAPLLGKNYYMVKALRLQKTPSGTYYNTSLGIADSAEFLPAPKAIIAVNDSEQCENNNAFVIKNGISPVHPLGYTQRWWVDGASQTVTDSLVTSFGISGFYTVGFAVISGSGCYDSATVNLLVNAMPVSDIVLTKGGQCDDSTNVEFTTTAVGVDYTWLFSDGDSLFTQTAARNFADSGQQSVQLVVKDPLTGCINDNETHSVYIKLKPAPKAAISVNNAAQCFSGNRFVIRNAIGTYPYTYNQSWRIDGQAETFTDSLEKTFPAAGTYILSYVVSIPGCYDSTAQTLTVNANPTTDINYLWQGQCADSNKILLTTNATGVNYTWIFSDGDTLHTQNPDKIFAGSGNYTVKLITEIAATGCTGQDSEPLTVLAKPAPVSISGSQFMQLGRQFTYTVNGPATSNYTWAVSQTPDFVQANNTTLDVRYDNTLLAAVIKVVERDGNGCKGDTAYFTVWTIINSVEEAAKEISVYPVPASGNTLYISNRHFTQGKTLITVYDAAGKQVLNTEIDMMEGENTLDISALKAGVYYLSLSAGGKQSVHKVVKVE